MSNSLILFLWFLAGGLCAFSWFAISSTFMSGGHDTFDPFGCYWIILKSFFYGGVCLLLGLSLLNNMENAKHWWLIAVLAVSCVFLDRWPLDDDNKSILDRAIAYGGYFISRIHPYRPIDSPLPEEQKFVIPPDHKVTAVTPLGEISVSAGSGSLRTINWQGVTRKIALISNSRKSSIAGFDFRSNQANPSGYIWKMHKGIAKCHYYEAIKYCDNAKQASAFLASMKEPVIPGVASSDGLVVAWSTETESDVLTVLIYQVLVKGQKPINLAGADDSKIALTPCK
jgi:hypothetical protein